MSAIFEWVPEPGTLGGFEWLASPFEWIEAPVEESMSHAAARAAIVDGLRGVFGREPSLREAQYMQAVSCLEGAYGGGWRRMCEKYGPEKCCNDGAPTYNMGSIQRSLPPCPPGSFLCVDRTASGQPYDVCFKSYASAADGFADLARVLYQKRPTVLAATGGGIREFAETMRASKYYVAPASEYAKGLESCLKRITMALGEQMPPVEGTSSTNGTKMLLWAGVAGALGYAAYRFIPAVRVLVPV